MTSHCNEPRFFNPVICQRTCSLFPHLVCVFSCSLVSSSLDHMNCSLPGSSLHGLFQARTLEWVSTSNFRGSSQPRGWTCVSCISCVGRQTLYHWATGKACHVVRVQVFLWDYHFNSSWYIHRSGITGSYQVALLVKNPPVNAGDIQETWVWSLSQEDPLEKEMVTSSSILAWEIPWTETPGATLQDAAKSQTQLSIHTHTHTHTHWLYF